MNNVWIWLVVIGVLCLVSMFFSTIAVALHTFSRVQLQDAFRARGRERLADKFARNAERLGVILCILPPYRSIWQLSRFLLAWFALQTDWRITRGKLFRICYRLADVSIFSIAIPQSLAKYAGEKILAKRLLCCDFRLIAGADPADCRSL